MLTDSLVDLMMILPLLRLFSSLAMPWYHLALTFLSHIVIVTLQFIILHGDPLNPPSPPCGARSCMVAYLALLLCPQVPDNSCQDDIEDHDDIDHGK